MPPGCSLGGPPAASCPCCGGPGGLGGGSPEIQGLPGPAGAPSTVQLHCMVLPGGGEGRVWAWWEAGAAEAGGEGGRQEKRGDSRGEQRLRRDPGAARRQEAPPTIPRARPASSGVSSGPGLGLSHLQVGPIPCPCGGGW